MEREVFLAPSATIGSSLQVQPWNGVMSFGAPGDQNVTTVGIMEVPATDKAF